MCQAAKPVNTRGVLMERLIPSYYSGLSVVADNDLLRVSRDSECTTFLQAPLEGGWLGAEQSLFGKQAKSPPIPASGKRRN